MVLRMVLRETVNIICDCCVVSILVLVIGLIYRTRI